MVELGVLMTRGNQKDKKDTKLALGSALSEPKLILPTKT